jgi:GMP synthase (glutamine-hydrolysing)
MIEIKGGKLFNGFGQGEETPVWMSHGDHVDTAPPGYRITRLERQCTGRGIRAHLEAALRRAVPPEVAHTPRCGEILHNFLFEVCRCVPDWIREIHRQARSPESASW